MKRTKAFIIIFFILSFSQLFAQNFKGWNIYTSMRNVRSMDLKNNKIWSATSGGLFSFDITGNTFNIIKYTTLDGLGSNQLNSVFIDNTGKIWSGSIDGGISIFDPSDNSWKYINDIKHSSETSKGINHCFQYGNFLFISTEFSIIKMNISELQFVDQPYVYLGPLIAPKPFVNETYVVNDTIWAATNFGIAYADIKNNLPISANWKNYTNQNSPLISNIINSVTYFNNRVTFATEKGLAYIEGNALYRYLPLYNGIPLDTPIVRVYVKNNTFYFITRGDNSVYRINQTNPGIAELVVSNINANTLKVSDAGDVYIGTIDNGVVKNQPSLKIIPDGPYSNLIFEMSVDLSQNLWAASGSQGFYKFDGIKWTNYVVSEYPAIISNNYKHVHASRFNSTVWVGNFGSGLLKIDGSNMTMYTDQNSVLKSFGTNFVIIEGMDEDNDGNLWLANRAVNTPLVNFGQQLVYPAPENQLQNTYIYLVVDKYNTKWMTFPNDVTGSERGIAYFNESVPTGRIIRASQLGQDMTAANDIIVENNGEVWVATDNGVSVISDPYQVINNPNSIPATTKMRIIENGLSTPLTENVQSLKNDALNNKWLGTKTNGAIYVSSDGSTILKQFNTSNSPIPDNEIVAIQVDTKSGKVYFGTQNGLASYQTVAVEPLTDCDKIIVAPNPFMIPSDVLLKIDGLVEGSAIKILSISGSLIAEFDSPGGRIGNWDGRDKSGNLVPSGIYIIAGYNKDGSKVCTGKVAVVRK